MAATAVEVGDIRDALRLAYSTVNQKAALSLQEVDVIGLIASDCFETTLRAIYSEILHLQHASPPSDEQLNDAMSTLLEDPSLENRKSATYSALIDLLGQRIKSMTIGRQHFVAVARKQESAGAVPKLLKDICEATGVSEGPVEEMVPKFEAAWAANPLSKKAVSAKGLPHLIIGRWTQAELDKWLPIIKSVDAEYQMRREVMLTRLFVTIQAFLWCERGKSRLDELESKITAMIGWASEPKHVYGVNFYDVAATDKKILIPRCANVVIPSFIKKVQVGNVPDRGGLPQGVTLHSVAQDVKQANIAMQRKDQPKQGGGGGAHASSTQWVGASFGVATAPQLGRGRGAWKRRNPEHSEHSGDQEGGLYRGAYGSYEARGNRRFPAQDFEAVQSYAARQREMQSPPVQTPPSGSRRVYVDSGPGESGRYYNETNNYHRGGFGGGWNSRGGGGRGNSFGGRGGGRSSSWGRGRGTYGGYK